MGRKKSGRGKWRKGEEKRGQDLVRGKERWEEMLYRC